jgi:hypothetical protein
MTLVVVERGQVFWSTITGIAKLDVRLAFAG